MADSQVIHADLNRRILVVNDDAAVLAAVAAFLEPARPDQAEGFEVYTATGSDEALRTIQDRGPFAAVVVEHGPQEPHATHGRNGPKEMGVGYGIELLVELHERWPDMTRVLMTGYADVDVAVRALHEGRIFRLLQRPWSRQEVRDTLEAAVAQFQRAQRERIRTEQLLFTRETLISMTQELERRLEGEIANLHRMQELAARLNSSGSLEEVARVAAATISNALGGRPTLVELENPYRGAPESAACCAGGAPGVESHYEPVRTPEGEVGSVVVDVSARRGGPLGDREGRVLASLVSSTALAAHVQIRRFERDEAQHATVFAMARLAERRDNDTGQHLDRVSEYCRLIALGLREDGVYADEITDQFVEDLVRSAPLHDIGKVGIPDHILLKPGKLGPEEWEIMKQHTVIGGETMRSIIESTAQPGYLRMGHDIALFHHEQWNGTGYPRGLSGQDIPLCARIVAVADVYDALTTQRPYKEPWPHWKAMELLRKKRGQHFDPAVIDAFEKRGAEADQIRLRHPDLPEDDALAA